jgi:hypothetical protein
MKRFALVATAVALGGLGGCGTMEHAAPAASSWVELVGMKTTLATWNRVGEANWRVADNAVVADKGVGFLVTPETYGDFELKAEFYAEADTNSGIFIRCQDPKKLDATTCYEVNIWDLRPKPEYGTGAIVDVSKVDPMPKAGGKWNTYHLTVKGDHMVVMLNGVKTADAHHSKLARGVIGLQHAGGVKDDTSPIKFRSVEIRPL